MAAVPPKKKISQEAFDEVVKENMEDLGMDPAEALQDAIDTFTLQGVDLSGIITCVPGQGSLDENPVMQCLTVLQEFNSDSKNLYHPEVLPGLGASLDQLIDLCGGDNAGNAAILARYDGVELLTYICKQVLGCGNDKVIASALKLLLLLLRDLQSSQAFQKCDGPDIIITHLRLGTQSSGVLNGCFSVIAAAATGNEIVKESFVNLKVDELILDVLNGPNKRNVGSVYDAIRVLLSADDNRVVASQVFGYARNFAKIGIAEALVDSFHEGLTSPSLVSACVALKTIAVNDEICRSIADKGGIDALLRCIDDTGEQGNKTVARTCCSLLSKLAGSDQNKSTIVEKRGMDKLIQLSARFADDPSVLQEVMYIINVLCLRSPDHASRAIEAGAGDMAIQAMQKFPGAQQLQRNACFMIRNLVVRNPENRKILLNNGIEKLIRRAKQDHVNCKDAATDALRDLGVDNYNS